MGYDPEDTDRSWMARQEAQQERRGQARDEAALAEAARVASAACMRPTWDLICANLRKAYRYA